MEESAKLRKNKKVKEMREKRVGERMREKMSWGKK